jgi:hypothetical protein
MSETSMENNFRQEALKKLKAARKGLIAAVTARMKEQRLAVKAIKKQLAGAELTVPEIAAATGLPTSEVLWYVALLKNMEKFLKVLRPAVTIAINWPNRSLQRRNLSLLNNMGFTRHVA